MVSCCPSRLGYKSHVCPFILSNNSSMPPTPQWSVACQPFVNKGAGRVIDTMRSFLRSPLKSGYAHG